MQPRFVGRLGAADLVTVANAGLGFVAVVAATVEPGLAARLLLAAAIADALDGIVARRRGGTQVGQLLDSLADVASFSVAPALLVVVICRRAWGFGADLRTVAVVGVPALFVAVGIVRLGLYTAYDTDGRSTEGVQTTLAATLLAAGYLAGVTDPLVLLVATAAFCYLMVAPVDYPELYARDALAMGTLQAIALLFPGRLERLFPRALLAAALAYLLLAPRFYWRD
jgi:CDP-diacylglycerol--serine O-phosphatidyltransferase